MAIDMNAAIRALVAPPTACVNCAHERGYTLPIGVSHKTCARHAKQMVPTKPKTRRFVVKRMGHGRWYVFDVVAQFEPERLGDGEITTYALRSDAESSALHWERLWDRSRAMAGAFPAWRYLMPLDGEDL